MVYPKPQKVNQVKYIGLPEKNELFCLQTNLFVKNSFYMTIIYNNIFIVFQGCSECLCMLDFFGGIVSLSK